MTAEDLLAAKMIKAAAIGFTHQMELHNFKNKVIEACLRNYTDGERGTIVKRAAKKQYCYGLIDQALREVGYTR